ncbi:hypothetical protein JMN32_00040 [Fulvivirga sp. 29W222]|uniref:Uncharacterized protein n=1 Tax=Fulvivirga marina TaxID=2494733 RepID=A0A937KA57_9BACT|nr:hypothetical protein [Fulvivirga marina]MBL6444676.1 hypothetical protein [Fulvivirga marina]
MGILAQTIEKEVTADGELPTGFLFASVKNVGSQPVLVNGVTLAAGEAKSYPFVGKGYQAIPYQAGGSTLRILYTL